MRRMWLAALLISIFVLSPTLHAQTYGNFDNPCPGGLNNDPRTGRALPFEGHEYLSQWFPVRSSRPLGSYEYYRPPTSTPNLFSTDQAARWMAASMYVHCFVERTPLYIRFHADPIDLQGYTELVRPTCESAPYPPVDYDPYDPAYEVYPGSCPAPGGGGTVGGGSRSGGGTGGDGGELGGGGNKCAEEYVVIEVSDDDGVTWSTLWEGTVLVCE